MTTQRIDIPTVAAFIAAQGPDTKVYIGADSVRFRHKGQWVADYTTVVVVHIDGLHGCKVFGQIDREAVYDARKDRPALRLMTEVYKVTELYLALAEAIGDRYVEVHLDLNPDEVHGSSCVVQQAVGYVKGVCGVDPKVKPDAFAASYAADRYKLVVVDGRKSAA